jgi:dTDP-4-amino-4,6-dideoxygalactose transaminase
MLLRPYNFENSWSQVCRVGNSVGVANGMDVIEIGLRSLNIGKGDEGITTPMTAYASILSIIPSGATPVLADIQPDTGLLDIESVKRCIEFHTKAVLLVHLYGQIKDMDQWVEFFRIRRNTFTGRLCSGTSGYLEW